MGKVRRDALRPGDHIYSDRKLSLYFHHGIYVGDGMVIHLMGPSKLKVDDKPACKQCGFKPRAGIFKTCLDCFLDGHSLYRFEYGVSLWKFTIQRSGTCTTSDCKPADQVVREAFFLLEHQVFRDYDFIFSNCETFAVYCKTGRPWSYQVAGMYGFNLVGNVAFETGKVIGKALAE